MLLDRNHGWAASFCCEISQLWHGDKALMKICLSRLALLLATETAPHLLPITFASVDTCWLYNKIIPHDVSVLYSLLIYECIQYMNLWSSDLAPQLHSRVLLLFYLTANISRQAFWSTLNLIFAFVQVRKNKLCSDILLKNRKDSLRN